MKRNWSLGRLHALGKTISGLGLALAVLAALLRESPARVPLMVAGAVVILAGIIFNAVKVRPAPGGRGRGVTRPPRERSWKR